MVRNVALVQGVLFLGICCRAARSRPRAGRLTGDPEEFASEAGAPVLPPRAGYLRVVVDPWAEVWIDGQNVLTTPTAQAIPLSPGDIS